MKLGIASDHKAYETKKELIEVLNDYEVIDYGSYTSDRVDYPKFSFDLSKAVINKEVDLGIIMCGTGIGVSIACNKVKGIRCAKIDSKSDAALAKEHNNANVLAFGMSHSVEEIKEMIETFINSTFNTEPRYKIRIEQVEKYEDTNEY